MIPFSKEYKNSLFDNYTTITSTCQLTFSRLLFFKCYFIFQIVVFYIIRQYKNKIIIKAKLTFSTYIYLTLFLHDFIIVLY